MTISLSQVANNQTFGTWLQRTNDIVTVLNANIVTVDSSTGGSISTGNSFVNGIFGSNTLYASYITGGNLTSNGLLTITTNTQISNSILSVGNSSMNVISGFLSSNSSLMEAYGNQNNYIEIAITNSNTGTNASSDLAIYDNAGLSGSNFIDVGILNSNWSNTSWTINGGSDGYVYTGNTNLSIGTAGQKYINFFANGTLATNEVMRITSGANVGIGNTNPNAKLQVTGTANISGNTAIGGIANLASDMNIGGNTNLNGNAYILGTANIVGNVYLSNSIVVANSLVVPTISGNTFIGGVVNVVSNNVNVSTNAYFGNNLTVIGKIAVTGNATFSNSFIVTGNAAFSNTLSATGNVTFSNTLAVTGNATFSNTVTISNNLTVPVISGNTFIGGVINVVSNNVNVSTNTYFGNNVQIIGNLNVSGNLVYTGSSAGNIIPVNNSYSLGNSSQTWSLYSSNVSLSSNSYLSIGNTSSLTASIYNFTSSSNSVIDQFDTGTYRSAEYFIQASNSTAYQASKVLVLHDGTTAYSTEYAIVNSAAQMLTLGATKVGSNVALWSVPVDSSVMVKFTRTTLVL